MHFFKKKTIFNQFLTSSLCACEQLVAPDWKTLKKLKFLKKQNFYNFLKNRIFRKLTTDFENRTKRQAETKPWVILDADFYAIPFRVSSINFTTGNFHSLGRLSVWVQNFEFLITRNSWKQNIPENVSELTNLWSKIARNFVAIRPEIESTQKNKC